ncbi:hypothetical protein LPJ55_001986 [Coemansia sp. RSA 990]|nr:hypothetical protein LPJ55_001986 [Coemansia sp. RSA 990]
MNSSQRCRQAIDSCGVDIVEDGLPIQKAPSALFRYKLSEAIREDEDLGSQLGDFLDDLLSNHDSISLYLDPMSQAQPDDTELSTVTDVAGIPQTESLVRLMLGVDALQTRLISTLLEKFPEYIGDEGNDEEAGATKISAKLLRQLRWLDYVIDSSGLTEKLLETLGFVPVDMQREIILALPDIISDSDTNEVSKVLAGMLNETPELMLCILETLGSLECSSGLLQEARSSVISQLLSAEPIDIPVMMRFLLQSVSSDVATPTILRIRKRLDLESVVLASRYQDRSKDIDQTPDVLIFDAIATCLRSHKHLRDAWLKIISTDTDDVGSHTTLDIVVLLIIHQITTYTKRVESILRNKIDSVSSQPTAYTPQLVETTIQKFPAVFSTQFAALLSVSSWLIRTSSLGSQGSRVAQAIVVGAFGAMGMFQRQEISGELAVHIGSGNLNEVDTATRIYLELAQRHPRELRPFAVFIKGLLDYVDNLSIDHIRSIFDTLGILSTLNNSSGSAQDDSMFNDLYIYVRKQLSSVYSKYNRIGVVGTVSLLRQLGGENSLDIARVEEAAGGSSTMATQPQAANIQALRRAVQLLEMLMDSGRHQSWTFVSMTYDELAHIVETKGLHRQLLTWLHENVSSRFAAQFLSDIDGLAERYVCPGQPSVALSLDEEETTVLDIFNHNGDAAGYGMHKLAKRQDQPEDSESVPRLRGCMLACLPSLLRLIQVCEKALSQNSLAEIDALLVCGIFLLPPIDIATPRTSFVSLEPGISGSFTIADSSSSANNASRLLAGNALVDVNEDERRALLDSICHWQPELRRILCSSLYTAANWIREIVNAFADQNTEESRARVVQRVNQLAHIEADLEALAVSLRGNAGEFHPGAAGLIPELSDSLSARPSVPFGGQALRIQPSTPIDAQAIEPNELHSSGLLVEAGGLLLSQEDTRKLVSGTIDMQPAEASMKKRGRKRKSGGFGTSTTEDFAKSLYPFLRELSFSAFQILDLSHEHSAEHRPLLSPYGLWVILRELSAAVSSKLVRRAEKRHLWASKPPGLQFGTLATFSSNIASSTASKMFANLLPIFPSLLAFLDCCLETRARYCHDVSMPDRLSSRNRPRLISIDAPDDVAAVEQCIDLLLQTVSTVLHWDGLQIGSEHSSLVAILSALARQGQHTDDEELADMEVSALVRRSFDYILGIAPAVAVSSRALDILRMLVAVRGFAPLYETKEEVCCMGAEQRNNTMDGQISSFAQRVLNAEWQGSESLKPVDLEYLVAQHITKNPHDSMQLAYEYATQILPGPLQGTADGVDKTLAVLRLSTFAPCYKAVSQTLAALVQNAKLNELSGSDLLQFCSVVVDAWMELCRITQKLNQSMQRSVLHLALRSGYTMTDVFAKTIIPRLDACFFAHREEVVAVLQRMQKCTRILQSICNHSKVSKDTKLQSAVPQTKRKLEQLIFQVYMLMSNNDSLGAIDLGTLKHRDVHGQLVGSQIPRDQLESDSESLESLDVSMASESEQSEDNAAAPQRITEKARRGNGRAIGSRNKIGKRIELLQRR